jgi:hypothetical protein
VLVYLRKIFRIIPEKIPYKFFGKNSGQFLNKLNEPNACNFLRRRSELLFAVSGARCSLHRLRTARDHLSLRQLNAGPPVNVQRQTCSFLASQKKIKIKMVEEEPIVKFENKVSEMV